MVFGVSGLFDSSKGALPKLNILLNWLQESGRSLNPQDHAGQRVPAQGRAAEEYADLHTV
jgi:hypothetical protein